MRFGFVTNTETFWRIPCNVSKSYTVAAVDDGTCLAQELYNTVLEFVGRAGNPFYSCRMLKDPRWGSVFCSHIFLNVSNSDFKFHVSNPAGAVLAQQNVLSWYNNFVSTPTLV